MDEVAPQMSIVLPPSALARPRLGTGDLVAALRRGKWPLVSLTLLGVIAASIYLHVAKPVYTASIVAMPRTTHSAASTLLGAAAPSLLGFRPSEDDDAVDRLTITLKSIRLASELDAKYGYLQQIFGAEWNSKTQRFEPPDTLLFRAKEAVKSILGLRPWSPPTLEDLALEIGSSVKIAKASSDLFGNAQTLRISLDGPDPEVVSHRLREIFMTADSLIRTDKEAEYRHSIEFLTQESQKATQADLHLALSQLLAESIKDNILVEEGQSYVVRVIEWPYVPVRPSSPNGKLVLLFGFVLGGMAGVCAALLYGLRPSEKPSATGLQNVAAGLSRAQF